MFIGGNVVLWGVKPEFLVLDPESRTVYFVCGLFLVLMVIGVVLSWQIRAYTADSDHQEEAAASPPLEQMTSVIHQKVNNNQPNMLAASTSSSFIQMMVRPGSGPTHIPGSYQ